MTITVITRNCSTHCDIGEYTCCHLANAGVKASDVNMVRESGHMASVELLWEDFGQIPGPGVNNSKTVGLPSRKTHKEKRSSKFYRPTGT